MKSYIKKLSLILIWIFLVIALVYVSDITNLPENVILFEGEALNLKTVLGVNIETAFSSNPNIEKIENYETITVSSKPVDEDYTGTLNLEVSFLGFKVKEINVDIIENTEVVPLRKPYRSETLYKWSFSCWNVRYYWKRYAKVQAI